MSKFRYKSNCQPQNRFFLPFASDTNHCKTRTEAVKFMRNLEKELVSIIEETTDCKASYYIFGNKRVIATANMYDNATLIAEALICHSPYYSEIDVISYEGLIQHFLSVDVQHDRTNHIRSMRS